MDYFKTETDAIAFYLLEMDGEDRVKKLQITQFLYHNKLAAVAWRSNLLVQIDLEHPFAEKAIAKLDEFFRRMTGI
jgi:hypothetical protein